MSATGLEPAFINSVTPRGGSSWCCVGPALACLMAQLSCRLADSFEPTLQTAAGLAGYQVTGRES